MKISKRNRANVQSRWRKIQKKEIEYIEDNKKKYLYLKARLFGYLAGDGNILIGNKTSNFHHTVRFYPDHESILKPYCEAFIKIYKKTPKITKLKNHYFLSVDSKIIVKDIIKYGKFGVIKWNIPYKILKNKQGKIEWLRAFFDSEAYVGPGYVKNHQSPLLSVAIDWWHDLWVVLEHAQEYTLFTKEIGLCPSVK